MTGLAGMCCVCRHLISCGATGVIIVHKAARDRQVLVTIFKGGMNVTAIHQSYLPSQGGLTLKKPSVSEAFHNIKPETSHANFLGPYQKGRY